LIILLLCLALNSYSEAAYKELLNEGDFYRACGEYKRFKFNNGIEDTADYYLTVASIYALSKRNESSIAILDKGFTYESSEEQMKNEALIRSYLSFLSGSFSEAIFEYEDFSDGSDTLLMSLKLIRSLVLKDDTLPFEYLPDSIKKQIEIYNRIDLKNPLLASSLSAIPGLGEAYAGDYVAATRDFMLTTSVTVLAVMAFLKNKDSFTFDKPEFSSSYFKTRDYLLTYLIYSSLVVRFQNGSKTNSELSAEKYNTEIFKKYLVPLHSYIEGIYRTRMLKIIK
jgi:hypothetical protein